MKVGKNGIIPTMKTQINGIIPTIELSKFNKHWRKDYFYSFGKKRVFFDKLINLIDGKYVNLLIGLRRVGKTTLMFQLIDHLIECFIPRDSILYYSFDAPGDITSIINDYIKISDKNISSDKIYIFLDEVQKLDNWQNKIKIYYDLYPNIKFILSGSSSLFLKSVESLAGRIISTLIKPLFFKEFLDYRDKLYLLDKPKLHKSDLTLEFEKYLYRQFFDIANSNLADAKDYTRGLKNKIIKEDAKYYFKIDYPDLLLKIFDIIASKPGMIINYSSLGNYLGIDWRTLQTYMFYLEESFLINKTYNYSPGLINSEKKQKKFYLNSCSFFSGNGEVSGELYENYIQNYFDFKYFYRFNKKELDFIFVSERGEVKAIEVKYSDQMKKEYFKGINFFEKKFRLDRKIIISKNLYEKFGDVYIIPFWKIGEVDL